MADSAEFFVGELIKHRLFDYRGVIIDVDPYFMLSEDWYEMMAKSRPPKDRPWYRVLVHNSNHETYVAEQNLVPYTEAEPVNHPDIEEYFTAFENGRYLIGASKTN